MTDVIGDANAYVKAMTDVFEVMWGDANTFSGTLFTPAISDIIEPVQNKFGPDGVTRNMYRCHRWSAESTIS